MVFKEALVTVQIIVLGFTWRQNNSFDDDLQHHCTGSLESAM
jgi:hypothetical protein